MCKGTLKLKRPKDRTVDVAIKVAKLDSLTKEQIKEIMKEVSSRDAYGHSRVAVLHRRVSCATLIIQTSSSCMASPRSRSR